MHSSCGAAVAGQALQLLGQHSCMSCLYESQYAVLPAHLRKKRCVTCLFSITGRQQAKDNSDDGQSDLQAICPPNSEIRQCKPLPPETKIWAPLRCEPLQQTINSRVRVAAAPARLGLQALVVVLARLFNPRRRCFRRRQRLCVLCVWHNARKVCCVHAACTLCACTVYYV